LKAVWSHNTFVSRATKFTPFKLMFGEEAITIEEIKFKSAKTMAEAVSCPTEAGAKDFLESDRLKAAENLHKYQSETKAWRDKKVKEKAFNIGDIVFL
jgi:hypothetical protein